MNDWHPEIEPDPVRITAAGWVRALLRALALFVLNLGGLALLLLVRLAERPIWGQKRPLTPAITRFIAHAESDSNVVKQVLEQRTGLPTRLNP